MTLIILRVSGLPSGSSISISGTLSLQPTVLANISISFSAGSNPEVGGGERGAGGISGEGVPEIWLKPLIFLWYGGKWL